MSYLEDAKKKLELLKEKKESLLQEIKEDYSLDDEEYEDTEEIESAIDSEEVILAWEEYRDIDYIDDSISHLKLLLNTFDLLSTGDKKDAHTANKTFERLVRVARKIKKDRLDDIQKAQEVISLMDEIIHICDDHRQK